MPVNKEAYKFIKSELDKKQVALIAVSKTKPDEDILELYKMGDRDFGENYVQELVEKYNRLPKDIRWHFIGHLQTNKVKLIASFVQLIHGVDSLKLLKEINKQAQNNNRVIDCLLQIHIAEEETKYGLNESEMDELIAEIKNSGMRNAKVCGLMGIASFTDEMVIVRKEFQQLKGIFNRIQAIYSGFNSLSMGMSGDYQVAVEVGSTLVRIGSLLFGERTKH
jgi:pyridoxal phosphate enzyme (YggS family)